MENNFSGLRRGLGVMSLGLTALVGSGCTYEGDTHNYSSPSGENGGNGLVFYDCESGVTMVYDLCIENYNEETLQSAISECQRGVEKHDNGMTDVFFQCMYDVCMDSDNFEEMDQGRNSCEKSFGNHYM